MRLVLCTVLFAPSVALACAMPSYEEVKMVKAEPAKVIVGELATDTAQAQQARAAKLSALMAVIDAAATPAAATAPAPAAAPAPTATAPSMIPEASPPAAAPVPST